MRTVVFFYGSLPVLRYSKFENPGVFPMDSHRYILPNAALQAQPLHKEALCRGI